MSRTRPARIAAAVLTATAALVLTACGGGDGSGAKTSGKADTSADSGQAQDGTEASAADDRQADGQKNGGRKNTKSACTAAEVKVEAKAVRTPVNHLLLVATNTSKAACHAYGFPFLRFDADQATAGVVEESKGGSVTTIAPGKSAYAAVVTSAADGSAGPGREAKKLSVSFQGPDSGGGSIGDPASVALPGGTVHVDDSARVTYWLTDSSAALKW
ncbi:DUF4232 domain-containing protein [Streptomyces sp. NPDC002537]